ncbi:MAG: helix-turn-helix transcriptional regulator [Ilumatobacteraceae bacterium]
MTMIVVPLGRPSDVGRLIRSSRERAGLSQTQLAERVGTTQSAVSRWERGHDEPRLTTLARLIRACGRSASIVVDDGVDRAQIRAHLALTPTQRLSAVTNVSRLRAIARPRTTHP